MKITITFIELKGPLKFFALSANSMRVVAQLRATNCKDFRSKGFWTKHYTMTLWNSEEELKEFARSGAHKEAMKISGKMAKEIRTLTIDADKMPSWTEAKELLQKAKVTRFD